MEVLKAQPQWHLSIIFSTTKDKIMDNKTPFCLRN